MTPLTAEQYSELVVALEMLRSEYADGNDYYIERTLRAIDRMVAELCEERCEPEWQNDVQAAFGGIVQTPQC